MRLTPQQVLAKLADFERDKAQEQLTLLQRERQRLLAARQEIDDSGRRLRQQRDEALRNRTEAMLLLMLDQALGEQQLRLAAADEELRALDMREQQMMQSWLQQEMKSRSFHKLDDEVRRTEALRQERRAQQRLDDLTASRRLRQGGLR